MLDIFNCSSWKEFVLLSIQFSLYFTIKVGKKTKWRISSITSMSSNLYAVLSPHATRFWFCFLNHLCSLACSSTSQCVNSLPFFFLPNSPQASDNRHKKTSDTFKQESITYSSACLVSWGNRSESWSSWVQWLKWYQDIPVISNLQEGRSN